MSTAKKDRKEEDATVPSPSQIQKDQQQAVNKVLDETKDEIKTATREAAREIPQYTQRLGDIQEQTIQTTRVIADNVIAATRLTNNAVSANMELFSTALQQTKDNSRELSRLSINAAKIFNEASNDIATTGISAVETTTTAGSRQRR